MDGWMDRWINRQADGLIDQQYNGIYLYPTSTDIPLNWGFRFSFATDIARGMGYLHQKKIYHNRLRSTNCVIDDRWVVKISGI